MRSLLIVCHAIISPSTSAHFSAFCDGLSIRFVLRYLLKCPVIGVYCSVVESGSNSCSANCRLCICWFICLNGMVLFVGYEFVLLFCISFSLCSRCSLLLFLFSSEIYFG